MNCPNCGENEAHFVPPSFGEQGFFCCHDKDCSLRRDEARACGCTSDEAPECSCGGYLKQATIAFGQSLPAQAVDDAMAKSTTCDLFIVAGSSLVVYPAAQMPLIAKQHGAKLVIITLSDTPHDAYADVIINEKTGPTLSAIVDLVKSAI